jgi:hypothetical protein
MTEKTIHLNALDLDVSVDNSIKFYDDGFVKDLGAHEYFINWKYKNTFPQVSELAIDPFDAGHMLFIKELKIFHIAYLNSSSCPIRTRGHEETHFLHAVKRLNVLSERIRQRQGIEIDFNKIIRKVSDVKSRREVIAEIGGIFCQYQRNGWEDVSRVLELYPARSYYFDQAYEIYCAALEESLKQSKRSRGLLDKLKQFARK